LAATCGAASGSDAKLLSETFMGESSTFIGSEASAGKGARRGAAAFAAAAAAAAVASTPPAVFMKSPMPPARHS